MFLVILITKTIKTIDGLSSYYNSYIDVLFYHWLIHKFRVELLWIVDSVIHSYISSKELALFLANVLLEINITVWVMLFTGRQTRWDVLTWDVLTLGRFDLGRFDSGMFWLGTFWLGTFWLWDKKCLLSRVWLNIVKIYLGRFDSPKVGRFGKSLGTFWFWDVLTGYRWNRTSDLLILLPMCYPFSHMLLLRTLVVILLLSWLKPSPWAYEPAVCLTEIVKQQ